VAAVTQTEAKARSALIEVESYAVSLDFTASQDTVRSHTELRFRCLEPGATTFADLAAVTVYQMVLNGVRLDPDAVLADDRVHLAGLAASNVLTVDAECGYATDSRGLNRWTDPADGSVYTTMNCFPTIAPNVFCCFDQPDLRADFTLSVTVPAGWECVANSPVTSRPAAGEAGVWEFAPALRMRAFDLVLIAGPYVTAVEEELAGVNGPIRLRVRCRPVLAAEPGLRRVGDTVGRALRYYEELLGVACPDRELNLVFPPDLASLAMQVQALMAVSESLLQRADDDETVPEVLAHEVAHLWFGCMVEGTWWDDLWMGEAMASYMSELAMAEALGVDSGLADFAMIDKAHVYQADSVPGTPPVSSPVANASDALSRPTVITYSKGAAVVRQLAALVGDQALRAGLRDYLNRYAGASATLDDLVACWSRASARDLTGWAQEWLRTAGVNTLRPELTPAEDGTIASLVVVQDAAPMPRTHRLAIGLYTKEGARLRRHQVVSLEISGDCTEVAELAGAAAPDALVLNDGDLTLAKIRFDPASLRALTDTVMDVDDPVTEAVLWTAAWDMATTPNLPADQPTTGHPPASSPTANSPATDQRAASQRAADPPTTGQPTTDQPVGQSTTNRPAADQPATEPPPANRPTTGQPTTHSTVANLSAAEFTGLVTRRIALTLPRGGLRMLLTQAVTVADYYAPPALRTGLRERLADACLDAAARARPGERTQHVLAGGFAASAQSQSQLDLLRAWLNGTEGPGGLSLNLDLRGRILAALAARGLATDDDLDAYAADDPVGGELRRATCQALRPDPAAKETAWAAALAPTQPIHLARAHAEGIWVPGQEDLMALYRARYFAEALPALQGHRLRIAGRLAKLLYPAILADSTTIAATQAALTRGNLSDPVRLVLAEAKQTAQRMQATRSQPPPN
jgi:aminopeptidase N